MTIQQILAITLRLFAIWLIGVAIQVTALAKILNKNLGAESSAWVYVLPVVVLLMAALFWRFPLFLARRLLPRGVDTVTLRMAPRDATVAASAIIGLWFMIGSIPRLAGSLGVLLVFHEGPTIASMAYYLGNKVDCLAALVQCLLGLFLVTKPWYVARLVFRGPGGEAAE